MELVQLEMHTFPSWGVFLFYIEFLLDYMEDNLMILMIQSLFPYQGLILPY